MNSFMQPDEAKAIREKRGWTMEQAGRALGLASPRQNYWLMEHGRRVITFAQAELMRAYRSGYRRGWKP